MHACAAICLCFPKHQGLVGPTQLCRLMSFSMCFPECSMLTAAPMQCTVSPQLCLHTGSRLLLVVKGGVVLCLPCVYTAACDVTLLGHHATRVKSDKLSSTACSAEVQLTTTSPRVLPPRTGAPHSTWSPKSNQHFDGAALSKGLDDMA